MRYLIIFPRSSSASRNWNQLAKAGCPRAFSSFCRGQGGLHKAMLWLWVAVRAGCWLAALPEFIFPFSPQSSSPCSHGNSLPGTGRPCCCRCPTAAITAVYCSITGCCLMWHTGCGVGRGAEGDAHFHLNTEKVLLSSQMQYLVLLLSHTPFYHNMCSVLKNLPLMGDGMASSISSVHLFIIFDTFLFRTCGSRSLYFGFAERSHAAPAEQLSKLTKRLHKYLRSALPIIHNTDISMCISAHPWLTPSTDSADTVISLKKGKFQDWHICYCCRDGKRKLYCLKRRRHV